MPTVSNAARDMYALSLDQTFNLIMHYGPKRSVLVEGDMGTGKSSLLKRLAEALPGHHATYFDCTTKDLGDISVPRLKDLDTHDYVTFAPNEEFGIHTGKPVIIMVDEFGKANPMVKNGLLRVLQERMLGSRPLPKGSIVFATTNLGAENVGDVLLPHARNRVCVVQTRKPSAMEWITWGINNGVDHTLLSFCRDNPQVFQSFTEVKNPDENPYIYHPKSSRRSFVTPRSLEAASDLLKLRDELDDHTVTSSLIGTIGDRAAMDLMAFVRLADQLPTLEQIKKEPKTAPVPESAAAVCMVVYRTLSAVEPEWLDAWMEYMLRLDTEAQGMFANGAREPNYSKQTMIFQNRKFTKWAMDNNYMFSADKK